MFKGRQHLYFFGDFSFQANNYSWRKGLWASSKRNYKLCSLIWFSPQKKNYIHLKACWFLENFFIDLLLCLFRKWIRCKIGCRIRISRFWKRLSHIELPKPTGSPIIDLCIKSVKYSYVLFHTINYSYKMDTCNYRCVAYQRRALVSHRAHHQYINALQNLQRLVIVTILYSWVWVWVWVWLWLILILVDMYQQHVLASRRAHHQ